MIVKDLIVNGIARIVGKVYSSGGFVGNLEGTASNASKVNNLTVQTAVPPNAVFTDTKAASSLTCTSAVYGSGSATTNVQTALTNLSTGIGNKMDKVNPTGTGAFSLNRRGSTTIGLASHAEGSSAAASGLASHAEGYFTTADGDYSHAEGSATTASGSHSHTEGLYTTADGDYQHVAGKYNVADTTSARITGWGTSTSAKKNIEQLGSDGTLRLKGDLYVNCNDDSTGGIKLTNAEIRALWTGSSGTATLTLSDALYSTVGSSYVPNYDFIIAFASMYDTYDQIQSVTIPVHWICANIASAGSISFNMNGSLTSGSERRCTFKITDATTINVSRMQGDSGKVGKFKGIYGVKL